ncbi:MAG TPA: isocitrate lyase/phosphoenolpyruvate mutase family protein [Candidatus Binataceae bacterium]|nr:isocitrate lyase/phosphoenolpyruvate mutase family protein [Candidatus Binataceae bacterium]
MASLREMVSGPSLVEAPVVFNPLCAKLAEAAGFRALYLGGGGFGYIQCVTEANLTLTEMVRIGIDIRTVSRLPLILDGACGWGDPMHLHRTINMVEAAGFAGIEIEDQLMPKRAHHHIGIEHMIDPGLMCAKIREAVKARRGPDFVIIGRTNALRSSTMDDALGRAEAYRAAGADVLLVMAQKAEHFRHLGERLAPPLMTLTSDGQLRKMGLTKADLEALGFRLLVDAMTPVLLFHQTMKQCYQAIANGDSAGLLAPQGLGHAQNELHRTIGLDVMLGVERETVEK